MPRFVQGGPDLPPELIQARADGDLVIFAGAGISVPAGLPLFGGLVQQVEEQLGFPRTKIYSELIKAKAFDRALALIEEGHGRSKLFEAVVQALSITDPTPHLAAHRSLLEIATVGDGGTRLVTTNFDRLFVEAAAKAVPIDVAPRLPIPRKTRWVGIVHLHGLIPGGVATEDDLILTSADFGRAYLVDGWAARFVSELFRNFRVLFVGYGVDDPVMRYLLDALAAEKARGETAFREAYALVGELEGALARARWAQKGVRPLFYDPADNHASLYQCVDRWAELCREGLQARVRWALRNVELPPEDKEYDGKVRLTAWALRDQSGTTMRKWAEANPPLAWLETFEEAEESLGLDDLLPKGSQVQELNKVSRGLMLWLCWLMTNREHRLGFLDWFLKRHSRLHPEFCEEVRRRLRQPSELPESYRIIWHVLTRPDRPLPVTQPAGIDLSEFFALSDGNPVSEMSRVAFREALAVEPRLLQEFRFAADVKDNSGSHEISELVSLDLSFVDRDVAYYLEQALMTASVQTWAKWDDEFYRLLDEAVHWLALFERIRPGETYTASYSLTELSKARLNGVPALVVVACARCVRARTESGEKLTHLILRAQTWAISEFPLYWRLALHAAAHGHQVDAAASDQFLAIGLGMLRDKQKLWSSEARRDIEKFIESATPRLQEETYLELVTKICSGPSPSEHWTKAEQERFDQIDIRRLLEAVRRSGRELPEYARTRLEELSAEPPPEPKSMVGPATETSINDLFERGELKQLATDNPKAAVELVQRELASGEMDASRWNSFLHPWISDSSSRDHSTVLNLVETLDEQQLCVAADSALAYWFLEVAGSDSQPCSPAFKVPLKKLLDVALTKEVPREDLISESRNHSAGRAVEAFLRCLWETDGLSEEFKEVFEFVLDSREPASQIARIPLGRVVGYLYARDRAWTSKWLVPLFRRPSSEKKDETLGNEALWLWKSFLERGQLDVNLLDEWKGSFLELLECKAGEAWGGRHRENAFWLFVGWSLEFPDLFSKKEVNKALSDLEPDGFKAVARALIDSLKSSDRPEALWTERIEGWIASHWPGQMDRYSPAASGYLGRVACYSGDAFCDAVEVVMPLLRRDSDLSLVVNVLVKNNAWEKLTGFALWELVERYPRCVLTLIHAMHPSQPHFATAYRIKKLLPELQKAEPALRDQVEFQELESFCDLSGCPVSGPAESR